MEAENSNQNMVDLPVVQPAASYRPSGKVNLLLFIPLLMLSMAVAFGMAIALFYISDDWYLFFITPLLLCLPVLGVIYITIRGGRCRNRFVAAITGLVLISSYYGGYWGLNYFAFLSYYQEKTQPILKYETGSRGFFGFLRFYCKNSTIESYPNPISKDKKPNKADEIFGYIFYSGELILLLALGARMAYVLSQRLFYEKIKRWAAAKTIYFRIADLDELRRIVYQKDWVALQKLPKLPKHAHQGAYLEFITEYPKKEDTSLPVYVSIKTTHYGDKAKEQFKAGTFIKFVIKQMAIAGTELQKIAEALPELKLPISAATAGFVGSVNQNQPQPGPIPATDFREKAVTASLAQIGHWRTDHIADMDVSVCLSVPDEHRVSVKKICTLKIGLTVGGLICIFGGLGIALLGLQFTLSQSDDLTPLGITISSFGAAVFVLSLVLLLGQVVIFRRILKRCLLSRPGSLFDPTSPPKLHVAMLENSNTYHLRKLSTEDVCLYHADTQRRCLMMEGCTHRYIIFGRDITRLEALTAGMEVAVGIFYKISDIELAVILQAESIQGSIISPLFSSNSAENFIKRLCDDLGVQI